MESDNQNAIPRIEIRQQSEKTKTALTCLFKMQNDLRLKIWKHTYDILSNSRKWLNIKMKLMHWNMKIKERSVDQRKGWIKWKVLAATYWSIKKLRVKCSIISE